MKKLFYTFILLFCSTALWAQAVTINKTGGWLEEAFVEWGPVIGAESYNVYYTGGGKTNQKIDDQLIRNYGSYCRADIPGLAAGSYTIKVAPVVSGVEGVATMSNSISVVAEDRTGFAFSNGHIPGAYKMDGTPKDGAVILYITQNNKDTISFNVTGASSNPCVGLQTILEGFKKGKDARPLIIRLVGQITDLAYMDKGDIVIENNNSSSSHITFEGIGEDATADGWGIRVKNATNVEIRNIGLMNCNSSEGDDIGLQQNNDYIWVHNNDYFYGDAGNDADQVKGDGALDCKKSTYITFSYNHFWDNGKCNLLGLSENTTEGLYITYHHNWYDHSDSRHPRVRFYSAHVYNNYYDGNAKYGVGSTRSSSVFVEANYFRDCKYPMLTSMQGSDVWDESTQSNDYGNMPTFSSEDGGTIKAFNNYMTGEHRFVPYGDGSYKNAIVDFDAYVVLNRNDKVPNSVKSAYGSNTYNNFDVDNSIMYSYTPDSPQDAKVKVMKYAGRVNGGDFKWTFNNSVDDASYAVNVGLKTALNNYATSIVSVQGNGGGVVVDTTTAPDTTTIDTTINTDTTAVISGDIVHNFTTAGITSDFFDILGNLSTSKGIVTYGSLTLTQCLKMESSTSISFTIGQSGFITLIFNSEFSGAINIDGVSHDVVNGILTISIASGSHTITKDETCNLYYISIKFSTSLESSQINFKECLNIYPNPMTVNTIIAYSFYKKGINTLKIYKDNILLAHKNFKSLQGRVMWKSFNINTAGVYAIILYSNGKEISRKYMYQSK